MCLWRVSNILFTNISTHSRPFFFISVPSFAFFHFRYFRFIHSFIHYFLLCFFLYLNDVYPFFSFNFLYSRFLFLYIFLLSFFLVFLSFFKDLYPFFKFCISSFFLSILHFIFIWIFLYCLVLHHIFFLQNCLSLILFLNFYILFFSLMFYYTLSFVSFSIWLLLSFSFNFVCYFSFFCRVVYSSFCNIPCHFFPSIFLLLIWHIRIIFLSLCIAYSSCFDILCVFFLSSKRFAIDFLNLTFHSFLLFIFVLIFTKHNSIKQGYNRRTHILSLGNFMQDKVSLSRS